MKTSSSDSNRLAPPAAADFRQQHGVGNALVSWLVAGLVACTSESKPDAVSQTRLGRDEEALVAFELVDDLKSHAGVIPPRPPGVPSAALWNLEGVIPPQCYTRTEGAFNPCYVCHQNQDPRQGRENQIYDRGLQQEYAFSDFGLTNHYQNLFEDRSARIAAISDEAIDAYVSVDNYSELAGRLEAAGFGGFVPDLEHLELAARAFDSEGFALDGSWWVAFSYKPLSSTFWPTNGSTDDVMIRLPASFYRTAEGALSREVYKANLAILEAAIKGRDRIGSLSIDERAVGRDLDLSGELDAATEVARPAHYVGAASAVEVVTHLYPEGTEFLHTVRYVGVDEQGKVYSPPRMKEVRYMIKKTFKSKALLGTLYDQEFQEKFEGNLPTYPSVGDDGIDNEMGWWINGFIEGFDGRLRWTTYEERFFCMGCHNTIGSTIDKTFSFPRKVDGRAGYGYVDFVGMPDAPSRGESDGEILSYLRRVGGGVEFRNNPEMAARFYRPDGSLDEERVRAAKDVSELIAPSRERARLLNKAYKLIVEDQDFIFGRDATPTPPANVLSVVDARTAPTLPRERRFAWDLLLDWSATTGEEETEDEAAGQRSCEAGQVRRAEGCVDSTSDVSNCGGCGVDCPSGAAREQGARLQVPRPACSGLQGRAAALCAENAELRLALGRLGDELSECRAP